MGVNAPGSGERQPPVTPAPVPGANLDKLVPRAENPQSPPSQVGALPVSPSPEVTNIVTTLRGVEGEEGTHKAMADLAESEDPTLEEPQAVTVGGNEAEDIAQVNSHVQSPTDKDISQEREARAQEETSPIPPATNSDDSAQEPALTTTQQSAPEGNVGERGGQPSPAPVDTNNKGLTTVDSAEQEASAQAPDTPPDGSRNEGDHSNSGGETPPLQPGAGEKGGNENPEPAPHSGNSESPATQPTPEAQRSEEQIQREIAQKVADLPSKIQADLTLRNEYDALLKKIVPEVDQLDVERSALQLRIDKARSSVELNDDGTQKVKKNKDEKEEPISKPVQLETAKVLEERKARLDEVTEQARRQAAIDLVTNMPENQALQNLLRVEHAAPAKVQEVLNAVRMEADARRSLAGEELKAERGRMARIDELSSALEKAKDEKKPGTVKLIQDQLDILKRGLRADALLALAKDTESTEQTIRERAEKRMKELLRLSRRKGSPLARSPLFAGVLDKMSEQDAIAELRQKAKMEAFLSQRQLDLISNGEYKKELGKIAKDIDEAAGINKYMEGSSMLKFTDAQEIFEAMYARKLAELRGESAASALRKFENDELNNSLTEVARNDIGAIKQQLEAYRENQRNVRAVSDEAVESAKKQVKQKVRNKAKNLRHAWQDLQALKKATYETEEERQKTIRKARNEFNMALRATAWEATKLGGWYYLIGNLVLLGLAIAGLVKGAAYLYGQDGK